MCQDINLSYNTYGSMLKRQSEAITLDTLINIAEYFNVSIDYLVKDDITDPDYNKPVNVKSVLVTDEPDISIVNKFLQLKSERNKYKIEGYIEACLSEEELAAAGGKRIKTGS